MTKQEANSKFVRGHLEMTEELKPCPFCGGKAEIVLVGDIPLYKIVCLNVCCNLYVKTYATIKQEAIAAWNRRDGERE